LLISGKRLDAEHEIAQIYDEAQSDGSASLIANYLLKSVQQ